MSVNRHQPHVIVLPEDDANRQLANGFHLELTFQWRMQVLPVAGGWRNVLDIFKSEHVAKMNVYSDRLMVLLIDFDGQEDRLHQAKAAIPSNLNERVFILGAWSEPETLRQYLGSFETIGSAMAKDCREETDVTWRHGLLKHNTGELDRLRQRVRPILF